MPTIPLPVRIRTLLMLSAASVTAPASAGVTSDGLEGVYRVGGAFVQDRNGDRIADAVAGSLVLGEAPSVEEVAAAADIAARFGFETMAMDLPLSRTPGRGPVVAIGAGGLRRVGLYPARVPGGTVAAGEGVIFATVAGGRPVIGVVGGDAAGLRAASAALAGRLPYVWTLKGDTLQSLSDGIRRALTSAGTVPTSVATMAIRIRAGAAEFDRVVVTATLPRATDTETASRALEGFRNGAILRSVSATAADGDKAPPFAGARVIEVQLIAPGRPVASISLDRPGPAAPAPPSDQPGARRPGAAPKPDLTLANLYEVNGLLGDTDNNMIADRIDAVVTTADGTADGVIDLAGRLGLESAGVSLPLVLTSTELDKPEAAPTTVIVGGTHPAAAALIAAGKLAPPPATPGDGMIQIVRKAYGDKPALFIGGTDTAGTQRALEQVAQRFPHIWERGKDRTTLTTVENDLRRLVTGRSPIGQAATALYKLDLLAAKLKDRDLASAKVRVYVQKADAGLAAVVRARMAAALRTPGLEVVVESLDVAGARPIIDERITLPSEVDEFRRRLREEVLPKVRAGEPVVIEARLSEPPDIRERLAREAKAEVIGAGAAAAGTSVTVLSAYKQGYSWLYDVVRPALAGKPIAQLTIRFAENGPPPEWKQQAIYTPIRWLMEAFPADQVLARDLGLSLDQVKLEKTAIGTPTYEVVATGLDGAELYRDTFEPKYVLRPVFDRFRDYEQTRVTTGWLTARSGGATIADARIVTDLERFWDHYQAKTLPAIYDYVMALEKGKPNADHAPLYGELTVDVGMSEPDHRIGIGTEHISSLDGLHEDLFFSTLNFFNVLGQFTGGRPLSNHGRIVPIMRPRGDGKPGTARILFTGFGASHPMVAIDIVARNGSRETLELDIPKVASVDRVATVSATVRQGRSGLASLAATVKVDTEHDERDALIRRAQEERVDTAFLSADQVGALFTNVVALRAGGAYRDALAYHDLGTVTLSAHWSEEWRADAQRTFTLPANGAPAPFPSIRPLLPKGYRYAGKPIVQWNTPISPTESDQMIAKMAASFPEVTAYKAGESYLGRDLWLMDIHSPITASHLSMNKATTLKPTVFLSARQHANEVSSTSHAMKLAELMLTDPEYRRKLDRVNLVIQPVQNPDGAQLAHDLYRITPNFLLHAGYYGSLGSDTAFGAPDVDPPNPEAAVRPAAWRDWRPDIFLNPHGYPSHEAVMPFSEYAGLVASRAVAARDYWINRGWFDPTFSYIEDARYPRHKDAAFKILKMYVANLNAVPSVRAMNDRGYTQLRRYGAFDPDTFKLNFVDGILNLGALKGVKPGPGGGGGPMGFTARNPNVTIFEASTEAPDETVQGDDLKVVATAGLQWDKTFVDYLADGNHVIERTEDTFDGGISLSINRPRPATPDVRVPGTGTAPEATPAAPSPRPK